MIDLGKDHVFNLISCTVGIPWFEFDSLISYSVKYRNIDKLPCVEQEP